jgi:uncharacterized protein involved in copper resistance
MKAKTVLVSACLAAIALGAAGCSSDPAAAKARAERSAGGVHDPMGPLDNPAVSAMPCQARRIC